MSWGPRSWWAVANAATAPESEDHVNILDALIPAAESKEALIEGIALRRPPEEYITRSSLREILSAMYDRDLISHDTHSEYLSRLEAHKMPTKEDTPEEARELRLDIFPDSIISPLLIEPPMHNKGMASVFTPAEFERVAAIHSGESFRIYPYDSPEGDVAVSEAERVLYARASERRGTDTAVLTGLVVLEPAAGDGHEDEEISPDE